MMFAKTFSVLLLLACLAQQLLEANCQEGRARKGQRDGKGRGRGRKDNPAPKPPVQPPDRNESGPKTSSGGRGVFKGRFSAKDNAQCTWVATGDDSYVLGVNCKKGAESFDCEYVAKPTACLQYASNAKAYWKQIARSLKKQKKLCHDTTALVKAGMCRKAPGYAHFKLNDTPSPKAATLPTTSPTSENKCPDQVDKQKLAEQYCSASWSTLCTFFFSMVQNDDC